MKEVLHIILLILGFAAILFAAYYVTKLMGTKMSHSKGSRYIKMMDRVFVGNDKSICIIQAGSRFYVVGITNHHIEPISEITEADLVPLSMDKDNSFNNLFEMYFNKSRDNDQGEDRLQQIKDGLGRQKRNMEKMYNEGNSRD